MKNKYTFLFTILILALISCRESEYSRTVKSEMDIGVINDSLFLGLKLGQSKLDFFSRCWELNQQEVVTNGDDMMVRYTLIGQNKKNGSGDIEMLFYGIFDEKEIMTGMKLRFYYEAWSIWNKTLQSDQLIHAVKDTLSTWYPGNVFMQVQLKRSDENLWVKVDGNRRITIKPINDSKIVSAQIDDLRYVLNGE